MGLLQVASINAAMSTLIKTVTVRCTHHNPYSLSDMMKPGEETASEVSRIKNSKLRISPDRLLPM